MSQKKILIIGLDGGTFEAFRPLMEQGLMPNLKNIVNNGASGVLYSTIPPLTPPAWASFMTGKVPLKHKIFDWRNFNPSKFRDSFNNSTSIRGHTIWQILSAHNKKVITINLPLTYPPHEVNGIMVSGFDSPSTNADFTFPKEIKNEIKSLLPNYDFSLKESFNDKEKDSFEDFVSKIKEALNQRYELCEHLLKKYDWDVAMVHFQNLDILQHQTWCYVEPSFEPNLSPHKLSLVKSCYEYLDDKIGKLFNSFVDKNTILLILSDHGFGTFSHLVHPNNLLLEWGWLHLKHKESGSDRTFQNKIKGKSRNAPLPLLKSMYTSLSTFKQNYLRQNRNKAHRWVTKLKRSKIQDELNINITKSKALMAHGGLGAFIYILNTDYKSSDYRNAINFLKGKFEAVINPLNNMPMFDEVIVIDKPMDSADSFRTPDLLLIPSNGVSCKREVVNKGFISYPFPMSGTHRREGILIAHGVDIKKGEETKNKSYIYDIAPTILNILDLPIPDDMDGKVLTDIFKILPNEVKYAKGSDPEPIKLSEESIFSREEEESIEKRLKGLGYL